MKRQRWLGLVAGPVLAASLVVAGSQPAQAATGFAQRNLVADRAGKAETVDSHLVNAWGMSRSPSGPIWVSNAGTSTSTLYGGAVNGAPVTIQPLVVTIPGGPPSGQVYNDTGGFLVVGHTSLFIFAGLGGSITAWYPGTTTAVQATSVAGAAYTGLALVHRSGGPVLAAADFATGRVDVFDAGFNPVSGNAFNDPHPPAGYAPYNVAEVGNQVVVTYAPKSADGRAEAGPGNGAVDVFSRSGQLVKRLATHGVLNAPWGLTIAPKKFGPFSNDLLVGNFGDGRIHAYDLTTGQLVGTMKDTQGRAIVIRGLWGLLVGNAAAGGPNSVWFSAGPAQETHGLLGLLTVG